MISNHAFDKYYTVLLGFQISEVYTLVFTNNIIITKAHAYNYMFYLFTSIEFNFKHGSQHSEGPITSSLLSSVLDKAISGKQ